MPLIPVLQRQRQADICEFKASLGYIVSSRPAGAKRESLSQKHKTETKTNKQKQKIKPQMRSWKGHSCEVLVI